MLIWHAFSLSWIGDMRSVPGHYHDQSVMPPSTLMTAPLM